MPSGKVKWFNNAKGFGFIIEDGQTEDLFAHFSSIQMEGYKTLKAGQKVTFDKQQAGKGIHAVNIVPVSETSQSSQNEPTSTDQTTRAEEKSPIVEMA
jgi:CspA family cold shock protein